MILADLLAVVHENTTLSIMILGIYGFIDKVTKCKVIKRYPELINRRVISVQPASYIDSRGNTRDKLFITIS